MTKREKYHLRKKQRKQQEKQQQQLAASQTPTNAYNKHYDTSDGNISIYTQSNGAAIIRHYRNSR